MTPSLPKGQYAFVASCDSGYLHKYGPAYVETARRTGNAVHLHVVNPTEADYALLTRMQDRWEHTSFSFVREDLSRYPKEMHPAIYASARFHFAADLLSTRPMFRAFIMDIDSLFRRQFEFHPHDRPIGLYFRDPVAHGARSEEERRGMRVLAVCWIWGQAAEYAREVSAYLRSHEPRWFIDQEALAETYDRYKDRFPATDLSRTVIIDWDMKPHTVIWTGKGNRKSTDKTYLAAFEEATRAFTNG